jgi:ribosomal protein L11
LWIGRAQPRQGRAVTREQVRGIAEPKMPDLNANDIDAAMKISKALPAT